MERLITSYNARLTRPDAIARTFVKHPEFDRIAEHRSKILIGPRGVGKTTILKLLTSSGVYHLRERAEFSSFNIDYLPLYIPADTLWKGEAQSIRMQVERGRNRFTEEIGEVLQNALFVDYCFYEIIASLQDAIEIGRQVSGGEALPKWAVRIDRPVEAEICAVLAEAWNLKRRPQSFLGLKIALNDRQNYHASFVSGLRSSDATVLLDEEPLDFFVKVRPFFDALEALVGVSKWGLHFDEMEIAPKSVLDELFQRLRSFDQRAVIKFSLFPYADFFDISDESRMQRTSPQEGADYDAVVLSGKFKSDDYSFSRKLVQSICKARGVPFHDLVEYANSAVDTRYVRFTSSGNPQRQYSAIFKELARKDESFADYLKRRRIEVDAISDMDNTEQAARVRKIAALAEFRSIYLRSFRMGSGDEAGHATTTARKSYTYFFGFDKLLHLTEQNPRAVHFYFEELIQALRIGKNARPAINEIVRMNTDRFRALYATQVVPYDPDRQRVANILDFVDVFGAEVSARLLREPFTERPTLTFEATNKVDDHLRRLLGIAINAGALIADTGGGKSSLLRSLTDTRFRVSYQLAPFYPTPTMVGDARRFSSLTSPTERQPDLLSWAQNDE